MLNYVDMTAKRRQQQMSNLPGAGCEISRTWLCSENQAVEDILEEGFRFGVLWLICGNLSRFNVDISDSGICGYETNVVKYFRGLGKYSSIQDMKIQCILWEERKCRFKFSQLYRSKAEYINCTYFRCTLERCVVYTHPNPATLRAVSALATWKLPPVSTLSLPPCLSTVLLQDSAVEFVAAAVTRVHVLGWCVSGLIKRVLPVVAFVSLHIIASRFIHILVDNASSFLCGTD